MGAVTGLAVLTSAASAQTCDTSRFDGADFTYCTVDLAREDLRLFLRDGSGIILGSFARLEAYLPAGKTLGLAMNAGMYHPDRAPVGLYVENGLTETHLITSDGPGNFGLLPNGVFCVDQGRALVMETRAFAAAPPDCRFASQSGPMLVLDGALHPRFLEHSTSLHIRNGVGVDSTGQRVVLAISDTPVNFHHFARLFRDHLELPNALYFDGRVSRLYAPEAGRVDLGWPLGPIIGTVVDEASDGD